MLISRVEQLVTRLEKLARNLNIFVYKILKVFFKKFYISTIGDDINNISLFFILKQSYIFNIYLVINIFILKIINFL